MGKENGQLAARVQGIIFDLDGTLVEQHLDFEAMRREIDLPFGTPLLEALDRMAGTELENALSIIRRHELLAAETALLNPGVADFLARLDGLGVRRAVLSRNMRVAVERVLERCGCVFDPVLGREDAPYKPSPHGIWRICETWGLTPSEVLMLGDYLYDVEAGRNAGTRTALVTHGRQLPFADLADISFASFQDVPDALRKWLGESP
jgi:HAD superfamily hydrolase (TIGR01549 family)